ncbi:MAG: Fe-S cluster assembly ATPase SufC [Candidatus Magasanikbacteria bacterium]|nr:Fe-S cluster assembly ATPase SufC [Candidatus Magasanikbacteria bacterium]
MHTLTIHNLSAQIGVQKILHEVSLTVKSGEIHIIMGQNGSGKSTLATTIMGRQDSTVTGGQATLDGSDLLALAPHQRAHAGLFLGFQYPMALPGVTVSQFMRLALRALCTARGLEFKSTEFNAELQNAVSALGLDQSFTQRGLNDGFSGGEKKRMEVLQLMMLKPHFAILDEIDSGLDIDGLKCIANALNELVRTQKTGVVLITHYPALLKTITPHFVHIMSSGRVVATGGEELARNIAEHGYAQFTTI